MKTSNRKSEDRSRKPLGGSVPGSAFSFAQWEAALQIPGT